MHTCRYSVYKYLDYMQYLLVSEELVQQLAVR